MDKYKVVLAFTGVAASTGLSGCVLAGGVPDASSLLVFSEEEECQGCTCEWMDGEVG